MGTTTDTDILDRRKPKRTFHRARANCEVLREAIFRHENQSSAKSARNAKDVCQVRAPRGERGTPHGEASKSADATDGGGAEAPQNRTGGA